MLGDSRDVFSGFLVLSIDETNFENVVLNSDRPVLVDCWAPWCMPCRAQQPILEKVADELQGKALIASLNTEENRKEAYRLNINSIPALVLFKDGQEGMVNYIERRILKEILPPCAAWKNKRGTQGREEIDTSGATSGNFHVRSFGVSRCLHKQSLVVFKLIKFFNHELDVFCAFVLPDARFQKLLVFTGFGKIHADQPLAGDVPEMPVEFRDDLRRKGAHGVTGLLGLLFIAQRAAVPQPKAHGRCRHHPAGGILKAADTS